MTTIAESESSQMDEFFNFDSATTNASYHQDFNNLLATGPFDIDLAFAEPDHDEASFACLQHFSTSSPSSEEQLKSYEHGETSMMNLDPAVDLSECDFTDFPKWIDGMNVPTKPCAYCQRMRIQCKVIKEGLRKGSCTSCVALARSCSLTHPDPRNQVQDGQEIEVLYTCDHCRSTGLKCFVKIGEGNGACKNCVAFACECSLTSRGQWNDLNQIGSTGELLLEQDANGRSTPSFPSLKYSMENWNAPSDSGPKIGARFSRESIRILRNWLSTHQSHPYPSEDEKEALMRQTGLNKTQVTNWLANARRRGKIRPPRSTSPSVRNYSNAMDIPRRATPGLEIMTPLERWKHSPPEHEPASITAITKAVSSSTFSSGRESPYSYGQSNDDGSSRSICNVSSTSSLGTSHSSTNSFASAFSHKSHGSFGSFGGRGRRRRRKQIPKPITVIPSSQPVRTYQCTFCTETFKTKHDWQRHEKSLHLSLERWVCCPTGPSQTCVENGQNSCVFCGLSNLNPDHAEMHNYSSCADRSLEERTFYRKDHLRQHLKLVHDAKFQSFSMESWKVVTPEIRSRCGFCGIVMDSWSIRVDHLAEHFKGGKSMADWKGDWGFEPPVLEIVENGMPPYLIHDERNSMNPFEASKESPTGTKTLEDFVKIGLVEYVHEVIMNGGVPTDDDLLVEARKIVAKAEELHFSNPDLSWFRDLIRLYGNGDECTQRPLRADLPWAQKLEKIAASAPHFTLTTTDFNTITCSKERTLISFVKGKTALGLTATDRELQIECCRILDEAEVSATIKSKPALSWFKYLITSSSTWLCPFRRRSGLPRSSDMGIPENRSKDDRSIDYSIHNSARLENELKDWVRFQLALGTTPSDEDIQNQARLIVYKTEDPWNQTVLDDPANLQLFKRQTGLTPTDAKGDDTSDLPILSEANETGMCAKRGKTTLHWDLEGYSPKMAQASPDCGSGSGSGSGRNSLHMGTGMGFDHPLQMLVQNQPSTNTNPTVALKHFLNDVNCYGRLVRELSRFVATCLSPNNPNQHIPTDCEIQTHARHIIYSDTDPWNQTAADNAEWLIRFKRDVGLSSPSSGPGLPVEQSSWRVASGGSGFEPPYALPATSTAAKVKIADEGRVVNMAQKSFPVSAATAEGFVKGLGMQSRYKAPGKVFCSREMEEALVALVHEERSQGRIPSDEQLRAKASEVLGVERTAADDAVLLAKFKSWIGILPSCSISSESESSPLDLDLVTMDTGGGDGAAPGMSSFSDSLNLEAAFDKELFEMDMSGMDMGTGNHHVFDISQFDMIPVLDNRTESAGIAEFGPLV